MPDRAATLQLAQATDPAPAGDEPAGVLDNFERIAVTRLSEWFEWLQDYPWAQTLLGIALVLLVAWVTHLIGRRYLLRLIGYVSGNLPTWWARVVREHQVFDRLVPVIPIIVINRGVLLVPHLPPVAVEFVQRLMMATLAVVIALALGALLNAAHAIYNNYPISRGRPIKGYMQVLKLLVYLLAGFMVIAALANQSPWFFISGLGAMTAIISLIFRETILSFVAGIQLVNNDLIRVGDWIEMPQFNADGDVIDISLNVVQVRNWDKTITSIPTHKFLEHSFKNWRGMFEVGGRRISRTVNIDMTTLRFLTADEVQRFGRFRLLRDYIAGKVAELDEYNRTHGAEEDSEIIANARHLTNLGTFRAYILEYLKQHPLVHHGFTTLVRQQQPGPEGLPLQIWTHIKDTRWIHYENAQSDIFDHILAVAPEFGLRIFQDPTGHDLARWARSARDQGNAG